MTHRPDPALRDLQREVQRLFGSCVLALQAYEIQVKALVAACDISWPVPASGHEVQRQTLGGLVNRLMGDVLKRDGDPRFPAEAPDPGENGVSFNVRIRLGFPAEETANIEAGLRDLVRMRNDMVHHFLEQHELGSLAGCRRAESALLSASGRIWQHHDRLREWAGGVNDARARSSELLRSDALRELIVDGKIPWSNTVIVHALRMAAATLGVDGWTPLAEAEKWVLKKFPDEGPGHYGCSSWRQVIQECGHFDLQYRDTTGKRAPWYRVRPPRAPKPNPLEGLAGSASG